jgi:hypothetical protein
MNYTYKLCWDSINKQLAGCILRTEDQLFISPVQGNPPYQEYLAWLAEGNEPLPADTSPLTWDDIRAKRDQLILASDWTMIPGATVDQAQWSAYRQILRDLPQTYANFGPEKVIWPEPPPTNGPNTTPLE